MMKECMRDQQVICNMSTLHQICPMFLDTIVHILVRQYHHLDSQCNNNNNSNNNINNSINHHNSHTNSITKPNSISHQPPSHNHLKPHQPNNLTAILVLSM